MKLTSNQDGIRRASSRAAFFMQLVDLTRSDEPPPGRTARAPKPAVIDPQIKQKAIDWLITLDSPENIYKHWSRFQAWLDERTEHREMYLWVERTWHEAGLVLTQGSGVDIEELMGLRDRWEELPSKRRRQRLVQWGTLTALALCILLIAGYFVGPKIQTGTFATESGQRRTLVLADESIITLNSNTRLRVNLGWSTRELEVEKGEGIFNVHSERARPFVVHAHGTTVGAIGTEFSVSLDRDGKVVSAVSDGTVVVRADDQTSKSSSTQVAKAGEQVIVDPEGRAHKETLGLFAVKSQFLWKEGLVSLDKRPLAEWVAVFNEYNKLKLVIRDPSIAQIPISGIFRDAEIDKFVQVLQTAYRIRWNVVTLADERGTKIIELRGPVDTGAQK